MSTAEDKKAGLDPAHLPSQAGSALHSDVKVGTGLDDGGDYTLVYPPAGKTAETAKALNDAAVGREHLVQWTGDSFRVPADVAEAADFSGGDTPESVQTVNQPNGGGSSSPTVHENGFGNTTPGPDGNSPAIVTGAGDDVPGAHPAADAATIEAKTGQPSPAKSPTKGTAAPKK